jgi:hypothetical protein
VHDQWELATGCNLKSSCRQKMLENGSRSQQRQVTGTQALLVNWKKDDGSPGMAVGDVRDLLSRFWSFVVSARQGWGWQDFNVVAGTVGDGISVGSERGIER